jgi:hypothetical protein
MIAIENVGLVPRFPADEGPAEGLNLYLRLSG